MESFRFRRCSSTHQGANAPSAAFNTDITNLYGLFMIAIPDAISKPNRHVRQIVGWSLGGQAASGSDYCSQRRPCWIECGLCREMSPHNPLSTYSTQQRISKPSLYAHLTTGVHTPSFRIAFIPRSRLSSTLVQPCRVHNGRQWQWLPRTLSHKETRAVQQTKRRGLTEFRSHYVPSFTPSYRPTEGLGTRKTPIICISKLNIVRHGSRCVANGTHL
ncbi:hypothetical protein B0I75DRAFT_142504 [Yarrowia lipolytica]|nr:hypothetical protein B0I74DRAFT_141289 [Yarrowia lipolytica]RDW49839.1 hypothetical protein B0I75DRAFT_142504 [Yarrowia lipolytica]